METRYNETDVEVDLLDLMYRIALHWRAWILMGILAAVIAGGYRVYQNIQTNKAADAYEQAVRDMEANAQLEPEEEIEEYTEITQSDVLEGLADAYLGFAEISDEELRQYYQDAKEQLSKSQKKTVSDAIFTYGSLLDKQKYEEESIWLNLDYKKVGTGWALYHIDTGHVINYGGISEDDYSSALMDAYTGYMQNIPALDGISWESDMSYLRELIRVETAAGGNLYIYTYAETEDKARELTAAVEKALNDYKPVLTSQIGAHTLVKISEIYDTKSVEEIQTDANAVKAEINTLKTSMTAYYAGFNIFQDALFYFDLQSAYPENTVGLRELLSYNTAYVAAAENAAAENAAAENAAAENAGLTHTSLQAGVVKMALVGFVLGMVIVWALILLIYVFDGKIKSGVEVADCYGLYLLGSLEFFRFVNPKRQTPIDKWIYSWKNKDGVSYEERLDYTASNACLTCQNAGVEKVVLVSAEELDKRGRETAEKIRHSLTQAGIRAEIASDVVRNSVALEQASQAGNCILISQVNTSRRPDLSSAIVSMVKQNMKVVGVVSV